MVDIPGGTGADVPVALALDALGNVYVAGNTASADFPLTSPRSGLPGTQDIFAAKLDPDGKLAYSVVHGGGRSGATAMAVSAAGEAHVVGWTESPSFPVTAGAFQTQLVASGTGFAVKLDRDGRGVYGTCLPGVASDSRSMAGLYANGSVRVAVAAEASLTALPRQVGHIYTMESDGDGNIYIVGQTQSGSGSGSCCQGWNDPHLGPGDIFVTKMQAESLEEMFSARMFGNCRSWSGSVKIGPSGEVTVGLRPYNNFPMRNPFVAGSDLRGQPGDFAAQGGGLFAAVFYLSRHVHR